MIEFNIFDGGKPMAATMSFDDGVIPDRRLISIFDKYGIKGTFHLNSGLFSTPNRVEAADVREIYKNHEVALHGREHLTLTELPVHNMAVEVFEDKKSLEALCKYPIIGMSYANGAYDERVLRVLSDCGVKYSRTVWDTGRFILPEDFLRWHPTCHYIKSERLADEFIRKGRAGTLLYVWGHAYEFDRDDTWNIIENVCKKLSQCDNIWFATNAQIYNYVTAQRRLVISADNKIVHNPSFCDVWFRCNGQPVRICGGQTLYL